MLVVGQSRKIVAWLDSLHSLWSTLYILELF